MTGISYGVVNIPFIFNQSFIDKDIELVTPSNMGGVFRLKYLGIKDNKYHFKTTNSEFPFEYEWDDEELFKKVFWACRLPLRVISNLKEGYIDDLPVILQRPLFILKDNDLLESAFSGQYGYSDTSTMGAVSNTVFKVVQLNKI